MYAEAALINLSETPTPTTEMYTKIHNRARQSLE